MDTTLKSRWIQMAIAGTLVCAVVATGVSAAQASPNSPTNTHVSRSAPPALNSTSIREALDLINSVPLEVLKSGDVATQNWLHTRSGNPTDHEIQALANVFGCAGSIAVALAGVAFPAAKILKIRALIAELGGVQEAVRLMWGAGFAWEKMQAAGGALAALGAEFLGISGIQEQCFE